MKKRWIFVPLAIVVLALAVAGGGALAQDLGSDGDSKEKSFAARVAAILGIDGVDEIVVQNAFRQARKEKQDERFKQRLDRQVELGRLTQEQADENYNWYQARPDSLTGHYPRLGPRFGFRQGDRWSHFGFKGEMGWHQMIPDGPTPEATETTQ